MLADLSPLKLAVLATLAFLLLGPEKLPGAVRDGMALLRAVREFSGRTQEQIRSEWGPEFADFEFGDMHPRTLLHRHMQAGDPDPLGLGEIRTALDPRPDAARAAAAAREAVGGAAAARPPAHDHLPARGRPAEAPNAPPFDPDAT
ncbi:Sec-independent protein translocase TatB [Streptomyces spongiicola]|uniref:Sec-independent protein translocase TatB n=1 Tax=Streptomyces spongiicola TaxID=1690221 RepID=A0A388T799_9ACTN|nr:hypothetical protein [Streptomyces spongiicola]GBQ03165.1 Sec-independent protein translocase TatB [Streptomyces spongiicola]